MRQFLKAFFEVYPVVTMLIMFGFAFYILWEGS